MAPDNTQPPPLIFIGQIAHHSWSPWESVYQEASTETRFDVETMSFEGTVSVTIGGDFYNAAAWLKKLNRKLQWSAMVYEVIWSGALLGKFEPRRLDLQPAGDDCGPFVFWSPSQRQTRPRRALAWAGVLAECIEEGTSDDAIGSDVDEASSGKDADDGSADSSEERLSGASHTDTDSEQRGNETSVEDGELDSHGEPEDPEAVADIDSDCSSITDLEVFLRAETAGIDDESDLSSDGGSSSSSGSSSTTSTLDAPLAQVADGGGVAPSTPRAADRASHDSAPITPATSITHFVHGGVNQVICTCTIPSHGGRCRLTRTLEGSDRRGREGQGRPLGLAVAWCRAAENFDNKADHMAYKPSRSEREAGRRFLATLEGGALMDIERALRPGEDPAEPEIVP